MITTPHERLREDLKALVDGELGLPRRALMTRHVTTCSQCQKEMEEMKKITHNLFASEGPSTLSDPLRDRLLGSIGDAGATSSVRPQPIWQRRSSWIYGSTGAVALASTIVFGVTYMSAMHLDSGSEAAAPIAGKTVEHTGSQVVGRFRANTREPRASTAHQVVAAAGSSTGQPMAFQALSSRSPVNQVTDGVAAGAEYKKAPNLSGAGGAGNVAAGPPGIFRPGKMMSSTVSSPVAKPIPLSAPEAYFRNGGSGVNVRDVDNQAQLGVEVDDVEDTGDKIGDMVKADGGYVATNNLTVEEGVRIDQLTVKIPSKDFDSMIAGFARFGTVVSKNVTGEDITDKTGDANSDEQGLIDQVTETEQKLQAERMGDRRRSALEEQLNEQRSELAQTRSRLGTLRKTAAMSTVNLTLTERPKKAAPTEPKSSFWSGVGETNHAATVAFQSAIRVPIVLAIWLVALSPIWGPLVLLFRYLARKQAAIDPRER